MLIRALTEEMRRMASPRNFSQWGSVFIIGALFLGMVCAAGCTVSPGSGNGQPSTAEGSPPAKQCAFTPIRFLTEEFYPYNYAGPGGMITGQSVDVVREILVRQNCTAEIELLSWSEAYGAALREPDTAVFSTSRTPEREDKFLWAGPVGSFDYILYARNGSAISIGSLEAARKAGIIAVVRDDARHQYLVSQNVSTLLVCESDVECLKNLMNGTAELWLGSSASAPETMQKAGIPAGAARPVYKTLTNDLYIAFNPGTDPGAVHLFQQTLDGMKADGTYSSIANKYGTVGEVAGPALSGEGLPVSSALSALISLIDTRIHGTAAAMEALVLTGDIRSGEWKRIRPILLRLEAEHPEARFWYALPDGSYYTTVDNLTSVNLRDRSYFPGVLAGNTSIGTVVVSKSTGRSTAIVAVPIRDRDNVSGVLGASVYCDTLGTDLSRELPLPQGYYFFALDGTGMTVLDSLPDRIFSLGEADDALKEIRLHPDGTVTYRYDGVPHHAVFGTSQRTGWKVAVGWAG